MAYARCGYAHLVLVHGNDTPTETEWQRYLGDAGRWFPELTGILVVTDGGGPTSSQRRALNATAVRSGQTSIRTAVVSNSLFVRGIVNAINLVSPRIRAFRPDTMPDAFTYIGASLHIPALLATVDELRLRLRA